MGFRFMPLIYVGAAKVVFWASVLTFGFTMSFLSTFGESVAVSASSSYFF